MVQPSCPILVILDDDPFRKSLVRALDLKNFSVTFAADGEQAIDLLRSKASGFKVILLGIDVRKEKGIRTVEYLRENRNGTCGVIIIGEPTPELRTFAPWADETLMKPVDPEYVATRARTYCSC